MHIIHALNKDLTCFRMQSLFSKPIEGFRRVHSLRGSVWKFSEPSCSRFEPSEATTWVIFKETFQLGEIGLSCFNAERVSPALGLWRIFWAFCCRDAASLHIRFCTMAF